MMNHPTSEADDSSTLAISVLYVVDVLGCLHTFLLYPFLDGLTQTRGVNQTRLRTQTGDGLLNLSFILSRTTSELGHLLKG